MITCIITKLYHFDDNINKTSNINVSDDDNINDYHYTDNNDGDSNNSKQ